MEKLSAWNHTSYLSQAPQAVPVEKNSAMWRNFRLNAEIVPFKRGENLSHGEISPHEKCLDKSVKCRINNVFNFLCFVAFYTVLLQNLSFMRFTLFCREICFVAIHALWRGEKLSKKFYLWRKKDKYEVCVKPVRHPRLKVSLLFKHCCTVPWHGLEKRFFTIEPEVVLVVAEVAG